MLDGDMCNPPKYAPVSNKNKLDVKCRFMLALAIRHENTRLILCWFFFDFSFIANVGSI